MFPSDTKSVMTRNVVPGDVGYVSRCWDSVAVYNDRSAYLATHIHPWRSRGIYRRLVRGLSADAAGTPCQFHGWLLLH
jgi:hypothetical protein